MPKEADPELVPNIPRRAVGGSKSVDSHLKMEHHDERCIRVGMKPVVRLCFTVFHL